MKAIRQAIGAVVVAAVLIGAALLLYAAIRDRPQDLPWTKLDLSQPVGMFTSSKLTALTRDVAQCRALLDRAGVAYTALAPVDAQGQCGYADGVRFDAGGARRLRFAPAGLGVSCPVAASLAMWEWNVVQPAAQEILGQRVRTVEHFGSYNCRRLYGRDAGAWSEHATADAVDIAGFVLVDGTRITVVRDWDATGADADKAAFLRAVRDGACELFATTLSPDYNAAHRDHLHLDHADRGAMRWGVCR